LLILFSDRRPPTGGTHADSSSDILGLTQQSV
jgi:hypothetical protein